MILIDSENRWYKKSLLLTDILLVGGSQTVFSGGSFSPSGTPPDVTSLTQSPDVEACVACLQSSSQRKTLTLPRRWQDKHIEIILKHTARQIVEACIIYSEEKV